MSEKCRVCGEAAKPLFRAKVLHKYDVDYFECPACGFVQTQEPFWLAEAYARSINDEDTGMLSRNADFAERLSALLFALTGPQGKYLDFAGGYGVFTRMMRDRGFDFRWADKYTQNLFAQGFEYRSGDDVDAMTVFEAFEHFVDPVLELERLLQISNVIVFSTELVPEHTPRAGEWWYYGHQHGQHIAFYRPQTLQALADRFGARCVSNGKNLHLFLRGGRAPYCIPEAKFGELNQQTNGRLAAHYVRTGPRSERKQSWWRYYADALRHRAYRVLSCELTPAQSAEIGGQLAESAVFINYVRFLLLGEPKSWGKLLRVRLQSRTFADMEWVVKARASSR